MTAMSDNEKQANPMQRPEEQASGRDGAPRFGLLLLVLGAAVGFIIAVTFASAAWFGL
jgi:hypothetical protein